MIRNLWLRFKRFVLPTPLAFIMKYLSKALYHSCTIKVQGLEKFTATAIKGKCILIMWHNRMVLTCEFFKHYAPDIHYAAFLSKSRDGEPIARGIASYPNSSCIRVSHANRHNALRAMIARLKNTRDVVIITPDGPRGPRYKVKEGVILAAKAAEANIIPFTWEADRYWQIKTWDLLRLPRPFSTITIALGEPIALAEHCSNEEAALQLERALFDVAKLS